MTTPGRAARGRDGADSPGRQQRCVKCDTDLDVLPQDAAGVPVCSLSACAAYGARCDAVISALAELSGWSTVVAVTAAISTVTRTALTSSAVYYIVRRLGHVGLVASRVPPTERRNSGAGRRPHVHRLTTAGHVVAATIPAPTTPATPATTAAAPAVCAARSPARPAVGYLSSARLSISEQRRVARLLAQWSRERGLDLVDVFSETRPGARDKFDDVLAAVARRDCRAVVVPSYGHLAVDPRRQNTMIADLDDAGVVVVAMDDLGDRGDLA